MHTQESRNHTVTKFAAFVRAISDTMCTELCSKPTTFDKVTVKKLKKYQWTQVCEPENGRCQSLF